MQHRKERTLDARLGAVPPRRGDLHKILAPVIGVALLCVALWFLHRELAQSTLAAVLAHMAAIPTSALIASLACTIGGYLALTGYDAAAIRYVGRRLPYHRIALTSFMAFAVGHNVGVSPVSGGSVRYRVYSPLGLSASEIARIVIFCSVTFGLGASLMLGLALLFMPPAQTELLPIPLLLLRSVGGVLAAAPVAYVALALRRQAPFTIRSWRLVLPSPSVAWAQIALSVLDLGFACATLWVLLAPQLSMGFFPFLGLYLIALAAGLASSVPAGLGVFEAVMVAALPQLDPASLLGTIIAYRMIYYVVPLGIATILLASYEFIQHRHLLQRSVERGGAWLSNIAPQMVGSAVFLAGLVLLISGSTPAVESRLNFIAKGIPLPVLELSHLTGSMLGAGLLILARGLHRRLRRAYRVAMVVLAVGIAASLLKGLDYEEALVLSAIIALLWLSRDEFYRTGSVASQRFTPWWIAALVLALVVMVWVGLINYRHVSYSNELWWQFALHGDAPRMLRASLVAAMTVGAFACWKLLRGSTLSPLAEPTDMERVRAVVAQATDASANLALLGDKRFLWSEDRRAFIMYQLSGDSWIAMGDPVGPAEAHEELVWAYRELVDRHDGRPVFYQVAGDALPLYVDTDLALSKLGEDARVPLCDFSLVGSERAELRQAVNRAVREGASFDVVPRARVAEIMAALRAVSQDWLKDKSASEKAFSLGSFSESYVCQFDCAVVRVAGEIVAFANLWPAPAGGELSIDLMRHDRRAPKVVMDYLFAELLQWAKAQGYQHFSLGMAPLAGLEQGPIAPLWNRLGHLIFTHGEAFYNFEGLRRYKEKFNPIWEPRYIACPDGMYNLTRALLDASRLISGSHARDMAK